MPGLMQLGKTFPAEKQQGQNPPVSMSSVLDECGQCGWSHKDREGNGQLLKRSQEANHARVGTNESQQSFHSE